MDTLGVEFFVVEGVLCVVDAGAGVLALWLSGQPELLSKQLLLSSAALVATAGAGLL